MTSAAVRDCPLCRAINEASPTNESDDHRFVVLHPLAPRARVHLLVVPRRHVDSLHDLAMAGDEITGLFRTADAVVAHAGLLQTGYRYVLNSGPATDQTVLHPHLHVLGGERLPPHP